MALANFFAIPSPACALLEDDFRRAIAQQDRLERSLYFPSELSDKTIPRGKIENKMFCEFSFARTKIYDLTFKGCTFRDCLFTGAWLTRVRFIDCNFSDCNFQATRFEEVYGKPRQFHRAHVRKDYPNVGAHFYQELLRNYEQSAQRDYRNHVGYRAAYWKRQVDFDSAKRALRELRKEHVKSNDEKAHLKRTIMSRGWDATWSWLKALWFGHGYRITNLLATTTSVLAIMMMVNGTMADEHFRVGGPQTFTSTLYFTFTTMVTLGALGYEPMTQGGFWILIVNALLGVGLLSSTITAVFRRVIQ